MISDFDRCFESVFLGNRQAEIAHKYHLGNDVWHICTVDCNDYYHSGWYRLNRADWTFHRIDSEDKARSLIRDFVAA